jgi:branched-chain amino acid transport system substrate-binding protein
VPTFVEPQAAFGLDMVAAALKATKPQGDALNVNAFAKALENTRIRTPMGEVSMRAADHQILMPMVVSMVSKDAKYKADDTDMGFKPVKVFTAEEAAAPVQASCKMQRPD